MFSINGVRWRVRFVDVDAPILYRYDGSLSIAACDNDTKTLYFANNLHGTKLKKAISHEVTHAAMFSYGVKLTHDQEELLADLLATYGEEVIKVANDLFKKIKGW